MNKKLNAFLLTAFLFSSLVSGSVLAALQAVGPRSRIHGFPLWYQDTNGLKLELCLVKNIRRCLEHEGINSRLPIRFPTNFPLEAFYFSAETEIETSNGGSLLLVLAIEAAFSNDVVRRGDRIVFNRVRIRGFDLPIGTYRITHPF